MSKRGGRKKFGHKGGNRHFSDEAEMKRQQEEIRKIKEMEKLGEENEGGEDDGKGGPKQRVVTFGASNAKQSSSESSSSDDSSDEEGDKPKKGVSGLIEHENPNLVTQKMKKVKDLDVSGDAQLSRREREVIEKEQAKLKYQQMHAEGKTDEARADLARLALIKKQREEAAKQREIDRLKKENEEKERREKDNEKRKQVENKLASTTITDSSTGKAKAGKKK